MSDDLPDTTKDVKAALITSLNADEDLQETAVRAIAAHNEELERLGAKTFTRTEAEEKIYANVFDLTRGGVVTTSIDSLVADVIDALFGPIEVTDD